MRQKNCDKILSLVFNGMLSPYYSVRGGGGRVIYGFLLIYYAINSSYCISKLISVIVTIVLILLFEFAYFRPLLKKTDRLRKKGTNGASLTSENAHRHHKSVEKELLGKVQT